jgi:hypothetical protein
MILRIQETIFNFELGVSSDPATKRRRANGSRFLEYLLPKPDQC